MQSITLVLTVKLSFVPPYTLNFKYSCFKALSHEADSRPSCHWWVCARVFLSHTAGPGWPVSLTAFQPIQHVTLFFSSISPFLCPKRKDQGPTMPISLATIDQTFSIKSSLRYMIKLWNLLVRMMLLHHNNTLFIHITLSLVSFSLTNANHLHLLVWKVISYAVAEQTYQLTVCCSLCGVFKFTFLAQTKAVGFV